MTETNDVHQAAPETGTASEGAAPASAADAERRVLGGDADRMDSPGPGSGGLAGAGADGETGAREQLRQDLGERRAGTGSEEGGDLEQAAAVGETDDPQGGSVQAHGSRP